jgi:hypothetical protein
MAVTGITRNFMEIVDYSTGLRFERRLRASTSAKATVDKSASQALAAW